MNYSGNNRRGLIRIPDSCHPLIREFVEAMNARGMTFAENAALSRNGVDTMRFWPSRHLPRLDNFEAALFPLDLELAIVPAGTRYARQRLAAVAFDHASPSATGALS